MLSLSAGWLTAATTTVGCVLRQLLYLLSVVMPHVPSAILRSQFAPSAALFIAALGVKEIRESAPSVRATLTSVGALLRAQEPSAESWARPTMLQLFNGVLTLALDARPKVRKAAHSVLVNLLRDHKSAGSTGLAGLVTRHCVDVLAKCASGNSSRAAQEADAKRAQQLLALLRSCLPLLPPKKVAKLCTALLRLCQGGKPQSAILAYRFLTELAKRAQSPLNAEFLKSFVGLLMESAPDVADYVAAAEFPYAIAACLKRLHMLEAGAADDSDDEDASGMGGGSRRSGLLAPATSAVLPGAVLHLVGFLESDRPAVFRAASTSLATILYYCIDRSIVREGMQAAAAAGGAASRSLPIASRICAALESVLAFRCQLAWRFAIPVLSVAFSSMGVASHVLLRPLVVKLVEARAPVDRAAAIGAAAADVEDNRSLKKLIREDKVERSTAASAETRRALERVLGVAISAMGPSRFLAIVPLHTAVGNAEVETAGGVHVDKEFLLPLLKTYVRYVVLCIANGACPPQLTAYVSAAQVLACQPGVLRLAHAGNRPQVLGRVRDRHESQRHPHSEGARAPHAASVGHVPQLLRRTGGPGCIVHAVAGQDAGRSPERQAVQPVEDQRMCRTPQPVAPQPHGVQDRGRRGGIRGRWRSRWLRVGRHHRHGRSICGRRWLYGAF